MFSGRCWFVFRNQPCNICYNFLLKLRQCRAVLKNWLVTSENILQEKLNHFVYSKLGKMTAPDQIPFNLSTKNIQKRIEVPNVLGKSLKKAMAMLANVGLKVKVNGSGKVVEQFPKPGSLSKSSKLCILTLKWKKD